MAVQQTLEVSTRGRGTTEITAEVAQIVRSAQVATGLVNIFVLHTSCSVILTENADPTVRRDLETLAARWAPDGDSAYRHDDEGDDDMAAHGRNIVAGSSITVPIAHGKLLLGTWQGNVGTSECPPPPTDRCYGNGLTASRCRLTGNTPRSAFDK